MAAASPHSLKLEMSNIVKTFPGIRALDDVNFKAYGHEVTALLGENGSGKSTLMKVLTGIYHPDAGEILWQGQTVNFHTINDAQAASIALIHQELNLFPNLNVAENIFLGREPINRWRKLDRRKMHRETAELLATLEIDIHPRTRIEHLTIGQQQIIEIAKALSLHAKLIIFDEPTTALTQKEIEVLFKVINELRAQGRAIIYISHRLPEIFLLADRIAVLRDGQLVGERKCSETTEDELVYLMVGRTITEKYPYVPPSIHQSEPVLAIEQFAAGPTHPVSFQINCGELVGIAGLMGAGRSEFARGLFGLYGRAKGNLTINGKKYSISHPYKALRHGICYVSEDRKREGLFLGLSIFFNIMITSLYQFIKFLIFLPIQPLKQTAQKKARELNIKATRMTQLTKELSGGNQQKVAIARALASHPQLIILDEPTKGIDVGAKLEIYNLMNTLKQNGLAIILISSDMPEVLGLSDRILIMANHQVIGEVNRAKADSEKIMKQILSTSTSNL